MTRFILTIGAVTALTTIGSTQSLLNIDSFKQDASSEVKIKFNGDTSKVRAGTMLANLDGGNQFEVYCVDLYHFNGSDASYDVNVGTTGELQNGAKVGKVLNLWGSTATSAAAGTALQLALWDVVYDGGDGLSRGSFKAYDLSASVRSQLKLIYSADYSTTSDSATYYAALNHGVNGKTNQNMVSAVPEPGSMLILAGGLLGLLRRRKAKKA